MKDLKWKKIRGKEYRGTKRIMVHITGLNSNRRKFGSVCLNGQIEKNQALMQPVLHWEKKEVFFKSRVFRSSDLEPSVTL